MGTSPAVPKPTLEDFDAAFDVIVAKSQDRALRMLKLDMQIPEEYERDMKGFLSKYFKTDPFDIRIEDFEEMILDGKRIQRIKSERRPVSYLSLFRFLELFRQLLEEIKLDIGKLAEIYKLLNPASDREEFLKEAALKKTLASGRIFQKFSVLNSSFYLRLVKHINQEVLEHKRNSSTEGYVNLRKLNGEVFLNSVFSPYYSQMVNNCFFLKSFKDKLRLERENLEKQVGSIQKS